jgi:hypothetical protein
MNLEDILQNELAKLGSAQEKIETEEISMLERM